MLSLVEQKPAFALIYDCVEPLIDGDPWQLLKRFICAPHLWPEDVDFWLRVTQHHRPEPVGTRALRVLSEDAPKRGNWWPPRHIRQFRDFFEDSRLVVAQIDFTFLAYLLDAMVDAKFEILDCDWDCTFPLQHYRSPVPHWIEEGFVRKSKDWATGVRFLRPETMDILNVEWTV